DVGTDNAERLQDPFYIGWNHKRIRGKEYDEFIDLFVKAIKKRFPKVLLQWEDFAKDNATKILDRYKDTLCSFNDDIQGTAAVSLATLLAAINISGTPLKEQRIVIVGAGSAGCGISHLMKKAMIQEGLSEQETKDHFYIVDREGLLTEDANLLSFQRPFAHAKDHPIQKASLKKVIEHVHPTLLIGVSGQGGLFTEDLIKEMAKHVDKPIIFPLSNPTSKSEATPEDLMLWTQGKAIIGTGSPFPPLSKQGKLFRVDQTNNAYIFPGIGLGAIAAEASKITEDMFLAAARALAELSPARHDPKGNLLPPITQIQDISYYIALAVAKEAISSKVSSSIKNVEGLIKKMMWEPVYVPYKKI
ncbi:MAG: oxaloacetate-decarboxylating malate dehydrogenase, partial [Verrucomicrobia bacterium]|nr:oxaloacetate-decarboxylating malate dehydrogenase [Verrucomicrobiota bacterium]